MNHSSLPNVAVLILGFNHRKHLSSVINSVREQTYENYKLIYIDNASSDGSADFVAEKYPDLEIIRNEKNIGYAGAYHEALLQVFTKGFDTAILLNPDTIVDKMWLTELIHSSYADNAIALAQSKVLLFDTTPTESINSFGNTLHFLGFGYCGHYKEKDIFSEDTDIAYASGASLLVKKEYYPSKISFDTDFFAYLEDQDLGWQARMQGLRVIASSRSKVWHKYDFQKKQLNTLKFYLLERNRFLFFLKNLEWKTLILILPAFCIMEIGIIGDSLARGYFREKIRSYKDVCLTLRKTLTKRTILQQRRKTSDKELFHFLSPIITFEEVHSPLLSVANFFLKGYYTIIKYLI